MSLQNPAAPDDRVVTVYWRPGCIFCLRLRISLWVRRIPSRWRNIWTDYDAAMFVRHVAGGNETVPTVVLGGKAYVNPSPRWLAQRLAGS